jgi:hypothetical protein
MFFLNRKVHMQSLEMKDNVCNGCVWTLWAKFHVLRKKLCVPENARQRIKEIINPFHHIWYLSKSKETECEPDSVKAPGYWLQMGACRYAGEL